MIDTSSPSGKIAVLVCDDSALMRKMIKEMIEEDQSLSVVATAANGLFALKKIPVVKPDIIILDIEMPEMNGLEFLEECKKQGITIPVIVLSSLVKKGARITMKALELGAKDFILKPSGSISQDINKVRDELIRLIHVYCGRSFFKHNIDFRDEPSEIFSSLSKAFAPRTFTPITTSMQQLHEATTGVSLNTRNFPPPVKLRPTHGKVEIVVIGISTGGPVALREMLPILPKGFPVPVLIVQHMPSGFTKEFAESLDAICNVDVVEAKDADVVLPGKVYIAPGDKHIQINRMSLATLLNLSDSPSENGHKPSVDVLFRSAANSYGNQVLAVLMTGMGRDGAKEMGTIYNAGGRTIAQGERSCTVYGMPRVAIENGYVDEVIELSGIARRIIALTQLGR